MKLSMRPVRPCTAPAAPHVPFRCCTITTGQLPARSMAPRNWERLLLESANATSAMPPASSGFEPVKLSQKWREFQGVKNWEGLLDPLDDQLRQEIIRYGHFVEASYQAFDFDPSSPSYASCRFPKSSFLDRSGLPESGYVVTKYLRATSGIRLPRWTEKCPSWVGRQSSWIGYVAACNDKEEIDRLGRRDIVIALRGTTTCLEWLENLRAALTPVISSGQNTKPTPDHPMVESGFLSLYTSGTAKCPSLQYFVREEIGRILQIYGDEPLSLTITGHSLGAALATLAAYDIKTFFSRAPLVTVMSFGGPRVGNRSFRRQLEKQGTKVLRIVNSDDLITKVPGFVVDENKARAKPNNNYTRTVNCLPTWIKKHFQDTHWVYADIGRELRLSSRSSPYLSVMNVAACHDLKTYLHLVNGFVSSTCPFRATARRILKKTMA